MVNTTVQTVTAKIFHIALYHISSIIKRSREHLPRRCSLSQWKELLMEIEFDVTITPAVLYDYMLHHTYTSASGLIGAAAGALMVVAYFMGAGVLVLIAGIIILAYLPWTLFLKSKQQYLSIHSKSLLRSSGAVRPATLRPASPPGIAVSARKRVRPPPADPEKSCPPPTWAGTGAPPF